MSLSHNNRTDACVVCTLGHPGMLHFGLYRLGYITSIAAGAAGPILGKLVVIRMNRPAVMNVLTLGCKMRRSCASGQQYTCNK
jgi:hypothetical protein